MNTPKELCNKYHEEMNSLFAKWEKKSGNEEVVVKKQTKTFTIDHRNNFFIKDGVVCPEQWFSQTIRPLFLLKEAYGIQKDLIAEHLMRTDKKSGNIWRRVAEWTYGLMNTTKDRLAPYPSELEHDMLGNKYIKQTAVVNVKKSDGKNKSNRDAIEAYAKFDHCQLKKQLEYCDPTIIVCGYTCFTLDKILDNKVRETWNDNLYYFVEINGHPVIILDYWHPANRYTNIMNYYGLIGIYHAALNNCANTNE